MLRPRVRWLLVTSAALAILVVLARPFFLGLSFVVRAADLQGVARHAAELDAQSWTAKEMTVATARGSLHGRLYEPTRAINRAVVLTSGHPREHIGELPPGVGYMPKPWHPLNLLIAAEEALASAH